MERRKIVIEKGQRFERLVVSGEKNDTKKLVLAM
jgi:hypothetical protein